LHYLEMLKEDGANVRAKDLQRLAVAVAEMAMGGRIGAAVDLDAVPVDGALTANGRADEILFSESQSRLLLEVPAEREADLRENLGDVPFHRIGRTTPDRQIVFEQGGAPVLALKGVVERLLDTFGAKGVVVRQQTDAPAWLHAGRAADLGRGRQRFGWFGELHPSVRRAWDLAGDAAVAEIDLEALLAASSTKRRHAASASVELMGRMFS